MEQDFLDFFHLDSDVPPRNRRRTVVQPLGQDFPGNPEGLSLVVAPGFPKGVRPVVAGQVDRVAPPLHHHGHGVGGQRIILPFPAFEQEVVILQVSNSKMLVEIGLDLLVHDEDVFLAGFLFLEADAVADLAIFDV